MKRCRHQKDVTVQEETVAWLEWSFRNGELMNDCAHDSLPTGRVLVKCHECGKEVMAKHWYQLPAWASVLWEKATEKEPML